MSSATMYQNWSARRTSPWHIAPCTGHADDKTTVCGRVFKHYALWSLAKRPDRLGDQICPLCESASSLHEPA